MSDVGIKIFYIIAYNQSFQKNIYIFFFACFGFVFMLFYFIMHFIFIHIYIFFNYSKCPDLFFLFSFGR